MSNFTLILKVAGDYGKGIFKTNNYFLLKKTIFECSIGESSSLSFSILSFVDFMGSLCLSKEICQLWGT